MFEYRAATDGAKHGLRALDEQVRSGAEQAGLAGDAGLQWGVSALGQRHEELAAEALARASRAEADARAARCALEAECRQQAAELDRMRGERARAEGAISAALELREALSKVSDARAAREALAAELRAGEEELAGLRGANRLDDESLQAREDALLAAEAALKRGAEALHCASGERCDRVRRAYEALRAAPLLRAGLVGADRRSLGSPRRT